MYKKNKSKYPLLKLLFIGKEPLDRKYKPHIIEYIWLIIGNFITISIFVILIGAIFDNYGGFSKRFFDVFNKLWSKILISFMLGNYLVIIATSSRLIYIQRKTEEFKMFPYFAIIFSLLIITSPFAILFAIVGYKNNIIEFV